MSLTKKLLSAALCVVFAAPLAAQQQAETAVKETEAAAPSQPANETASSAKPAAQADETVTQQAAPAGETAKVKNAGTPQAPAAASSEAAAPQTQETAALENNIVNESIAAIDRDIRRSNFLPFPAPQMVAMLPGVEGWKPNTVSAPFPREMKNAMAQAGMASSPWSMRQMINFMSHKIKVKEGLTFEQVIEAMDSRAIDVNFKKVGFTHISKELTAKLGEHSPHIAILHYCDALVGRKIMDYSPEFSIFLPCRISLIQDGKGDLYLMTMDWDVTWLNYAWHPDSQLDAELKQDAVRIRDAMHSIMSAGANGDW